MHNFSSYDSQIILSSLGKRRGNIKHYKLEGLIHNTEKFRTLNILCFQFIDSMAFLNAGLQTLVSDLTASGHDFPLLESSGICPRPELKKLLLRKAPFPYEKFTSCAAFKKIVDFPPRNDFYSELNDCGISEQEYMHGKEVYEAFHLTNMLEYTLLYNRLDVILLCEVMNAFHHFSYENFGLDCHAYISVPALAFDAALKRSNVKIELMDDIDMVLFFERGIRGGVSFASTRSLTSEQDAHILYLDCTNLYGLSMCSGKYCE